jgi:hypothetical protein
MSLLFCVWWYRLLKSVMRIFAGKPPNPLTTPKVAEAQAVVGVGQVVDEVAMTRVKKGRAAAAGKVVAAHMALGRSRALPLAVWCRAVVDMARDEGWRLKKRRSPWQVVVLALWKPKNPWTYSSRLIWMCRRYSFCPQIRCF